MVVAIAGPVVVVTAPVAVFAPAAGFAGAFAAAAAARAPLWRLSVGSTAPYTDLAGEQLIEWGGALRWLAATPATDAARLRAWAASQGGHATLFRATPRPAEAFHPLPPALAELHRRLKATFDPAGILNRHRLSSAF